MSKIYQFMNCRILRDSTIVREDLWVRGGKILNPRDVFWMEKSKADEQIDCCGLIIAPGFIDVQINGGFGVDFSSPSDNVAEGVEKVAKNLLQHGCTSFCPTLVTSEERMYKMLVSKIKRRPGGIHGAEVLGTHLEGPFINPEKKGAHKEHLIRSLENWTYQDFESFYGTLEDCSLTTIAPELAGNMSIIEELVKRNIVVSIGHSTANLAMAEQAARKGATFITHLFNAMLPFHHRDPGIVGLLTSDHIPKPIFYGLIADGIHTHPTATRIAHRSHPKGLVLITDAIIALGLPPGVHNLGPMKVEIDHEKAVLAGTNTLAGSVASLDFCVQRFMEMSGCSMVEAIEGATLHPAQLLNIQHRKGTLDFGSDADLIFLDDQLNVQATLIGGRPVWIRKRKGLIARILQNKFNLTNEVFGS
ncbi:predicted protein [Nematostella vectensis]|uniref:N-acetylglucosamine-6-phosphate deacetylase n=1 Tax=Nematostella vectensis TaxID=45351 RepID=A7SBC9_NEMVE|nr:predicted protein [Nematostella vectensis]|eukprot:XP_001631043.1 predicted protein [Nematostella vectensis]